ncbi:MAG: hypothetical protein ACOZE5_09110 [Verrucomicrobiota bacterium]
MATLLAAAAFLKRPLGEITAQAIRDGYEALKAYLQRKLVTKPEAVDALELATEKPESLIRRALLVEECASCGLERDDELHALGTRLAALLPEPVTSRVQNVQVTGNGNRVQVAGRDLVSTAKHITRNAITPDERHVTAAQGEELKGVLGELAVRLGGAGRPNFAGAHRMLQRRFGVASYLLLPRERFAEALAFLKRQRAAHRSGLLPCNPAAYRNDLFRAVFSGARALRWDGQRVYQFATEALGLEKPVASLKGLGSIQLRKLAAAMRRQTRKGRTAVQAP